MKNITEMQKQYLCVVGIIASLTSVGAMFINTPFLSWFAFGAAGFSTLALVAVVKMQGIYSLKSAKVECGI